MLSLIGVFFNFNISVYSQSDGKYVAHLRILLQALRQEQLCVTQRFYIIDFSTMNFYRFHQLCLVVRNKFYWLSHQVNSSHYSVGSLLKLWMDSF